MPNENRRLVVEHKDGRRLAVPESDFDRKEANPFNFDGNVQEFNMDTGSNVLTPTAGRPLDDHKSLKAEGFKPVAMIHGSKHTKACPYESDRCPGEGAEIPLEK